MNLEKRNKIFDTAKKLWRNFAEKKPDDGKIKVDRDWQIILFVFVCFLCLIFTLEIYIFYFYHNGNYLNNLGEIELQKDVEINQTLLDKTMAEIGKRKKITEENYLTPNVDDPSI